MFTIIKENSKIIIATENISLIEIENDLLNIKYISLRPYIKNLNNFLVTTYNLPDNILNYLIDSQDCRELFINKIKNLF